MSSLGIHKSLVLGLLCIFGMSLFSFSTLSAESGGISKKKVIIIGIDGCRFDGIEAAHTPNFDLILSKSLWSKNTKIFPDYYPSQGESIMSSHGPGWATVLSGVWHDKHGVTTDDFEEISPENHFDFSYEDPEKQPYYIFDRLQKLDPDYYTASLTTWPELNYQIGRKADRQESFIEAESSPFLSDQRVADTFNGLLFESAAPDFSFILFNQVQLEGTRGGYGPQNKAYLESIERVDRLMGQVVKSISERVKESKEEWLILVTSDHGGFGTHHNFGFRKPEVDTTFLVAFGPSVEPGEIPGTTYLVDVAALALDHLGLSVETMIPAIDGRLPNGPELPTQEMISRNVERIGASIHSIENQLGMFREIQQPFINTPESPSTTIVDSEILQLELLSSGLSQLEMAAFDHQKSEINNILKVFKFSIYFIIPIFLFSLCGVVYSGIIHGNSLDTALRFISRNIQSSAPSFVSADEPRDSDDFAWIEKQEFYDSTSPQYVAAYNAFKNSNKKSNHKARKWVGESASKNYPDVEVG